MGRILGVALFIPLVLFAVALAILGKLEHNAWQAKTLARAKQIGLMLALYAGDHDGAFPHADAAQGKPMRTSNDAFRLLFPIYTESEFTFRNSLSVYQTALPDNKISPPEEILRPGENVYSYVMGSPNTEPSVFSNLRAEKWVQDLNPLVVDGTDGTGEGTYMSDRHARGGVWEGEMAIVIHVDLSGTFEPLAGPVYSRHIEAILPNGTKGNPLSPAALGPQRKLLDPAVTPSPKSLIRDP